MGSCFGDARQTSAAFVGHCRFVFVAFNFMFSFVVSDFTGKFFQMAFISDLTSWHCNL